MNTTLPQPRNTERCPQCGYLLEGLPDSGQCPECGKTYDQAAIVIDGWYARGETSGNAFLTRHPSILTQMLAACAAIGLFLFFQLPGDTRWLAILPVVIPVGCAIAARNGSDIPPLQLVLGSDGHIHRYHPVAAGWTIILNRISAIAAFAPLVLLMIKQRSGMLLLWLIAYVASIPAGIIWHRLKWRKRRWAAARVSGEGIALIPWEPNDEIIFTPIRPNTWRIAVGYRPEQRRSFRLTRRRNSTLRFEADLNDQRVDHITAQMASWPIKLTVTRRTPRPRWWWRLIGKR